MYNDREHIGNSEKYHTGGKCIEQECNNPAGTAWSPLWCVDCNIKRISKISDQVNTLVRENKNKKWI